jgi:hypothetical protein
MSGRLEHWFWSKTRALHLEHFLFENKMSPPHINYVGLERTPWWAQIEQTGDATMYFECRDNKHSPEHSLVKQLTVQAVLEFITLKGYGCRR